MYGSTIIKTASKSERLNVGVWNYCCKSVECPNNLFMVLQSWKFISIKNVKGGILELLLEIECPRNLCAVLQS